MNNNETAYSQVKLGLIYCTFLFVILAIEPLYREDLFNMSMPLIKEL